MAVKAIPDGYHSLTPGCTVQSCAKAIEFYKRVFGAEERVRMPGPAGLVVHAEMRIGDSIFMLSDPMHNQPTHSMHVMLYTTDCDATFRRAVEAGCSVKQPLSDLFWGDRAGSVVDPFGNQWFIATHKEDVTPEELDKRMKATMPTSA